MSWSPKHPHKCFNRKLPSKWPQNSTTGIHDACFSFSITNITMSFLFDLLYYINYTWSLILKRILMCTEPNMKSFSLHVHIPTERPSALVLNIVWQYRGRLGGHANQPSREVDGAAVIVAVCHSHGFTELCCLGEKVIFFLYYA